MAHLDPLFRAYTEAGRVASDMAMIKDSVDLLVSPVVHGRAARRRSHRPWPMPGRPWVMGQTWADLLFAHWRVAPAALARLVPAVLPLDTFDGSAWVGVTPFTVRNLRPRVGWPLPVLSTFPEINVRTYVTVGGKPGIYFFSLDADSALAVAAARRLYRLPYFRSDAAVEPQGESVRFTSNRVSTPKPARADFRAIYRPAGARFHASPGSHDAWLAERYCLYTLDERERILRGEIHHPPWPLQPAEAEIEVNTMGDELGVELTGRPLLHYSRRQDVVFWSLNPAGGAAS